MPHEPEHFLRVVYRIAAIRRQDHPWQTHGLIGSAMPPGAFVTVEPPPPRPSSDHFLSGVEVKVDGVPIEFVAGRFEDDGRLCLFFDQAHSVGLEVGMRLELHRAAPRR